MAAVFAACANTSCDGAPAPGRTPSTVTGHASSDDADGCRPAARLSRRRRTAADRDRRACSARIEREGLAPIWISLADGRRRSPAPRASTRPCRLPACPSRSRTTSTSRACPPPRRARVCLPGHADGARGRPAARRRRDSHRQDQHGSVRHRARRARARRTAPARACSTLGTSPAARAPAPRWPSRRGSALLRSAPTRRARAACRRHSTARGPEAHARSGQHGRRRAGLPLARLRLDFRRRRRRTPALVWRLAQGFDADDPYSRGPRRRRRRAVADLPFASACPRAADLEFFGDEEARASSLGRPGASRRSAASASRSTTRRFARPATCSTGPWVAERLAALGSSSEDPPDVHPSSARSSRGRGLHGGRAYRAADRLRRLREATGSGPPWTCCCCRPPARSTRRTRCWPTLSGSTPTSATTRTSSICWTSRPSPSPPASGTTACPSASR